MWDFNVRPQGSTHSCALVRIWNALLAGFNFSQKDALILGAFVLVKSFAHLNFHVPIKLLPVLRAR